MNMRIMRIRKLVKSTYC